MDPPEIPFGEQPPSSKPPLGVSKEELEMVARVIKHLYDHPEEDQNCGEVKKIRHFARRWLDPDWVKIKKKEVRDEALERDRKALEETGIRQTRKKKKDVQDSFRLLMQKKANNQITFHPDDESNPQVPLVLPEYQKKVEGISISSKIACYVCKKELSIVHHFYDQMCSACGEFNFEKRSATCDLTGKVALVTGGRIKIGYEVAMKLLRCGCHVIVTSRFQNDTIVRYAREPDFETWKDRLHVYSLDLRFLNDVELFVEHILKTYDRLDIIINNAAQTIRRPPVFYKHLIEAELEPIPICYQDMKLEHRPLMKGLYQTDRIQQVMDQDEHRKQAIISTESIKGGTVGILPQFAHVKNTAELSQIPFLPEDLQEDPTLFPPGEYDVDGQQVDKRTNNSWILALEDVSTVECTEVHIVNALAPFILNSKLKPLMMKSKEECFIINVSSMEGKFSRAKKATHPHTNMAKAAMNMMTRTSAPDYALDHIYMNSVDTGWITYENPNELSARKQALGLEPPIDEIDGAARILDPIFSSVKTGEYSWGLFFKDYFPTKW